MFSQRHRNKKLRFKNDGQCLTDFVYIYTTLFIQDNHPRHCRTQKIGKVPKKDNQKI